MRERQKVGNGQVVIFENDEAYRFTSDSPVRKLLIKVTVEGGYFKNNITSRRFCTDKAGRAGLTPTNHAPLFREITTGLEMHHV